MSNLCISGFEDMACDEVFQSDDDLVVPHYVSQKIDCCFGLGESLKTNTCGLTTNYINFGDRSSARHDNRERERRDFSILSRRKTVLEKNSWPPIPNASFASASNSTSIEKSSSASGNTVPLWHDLDSNNSWSDGSDFCGHDTSLSDLTTMVDNSLSYLPGEIDQSSRDLDFLKNTDPSDYLCCNSWPAIGSFEDIERMLSCDSTFDYGISEKDEFGWLSSADYAGGSEAQLKDVTFPCPEMSMMENTVNSLDSLRGSSISDSSMVNVTMRSEDCSLANEDRFVPCEQINKNQSAGRSSSNHVKEVPRDMIWLPFGQPHNHALPSIPSSPCPDNGQLQTPVSYECSPSSQLTDPASVNVKPSTAKLWYKRSSRASPLDASAIPVPGQVEKPHGCQVNQYSVNESLNKGSVIISDPSTIGKSEDHGKREGATQAESGSSNVPESLKASSGSNSVSEEAADFLQLQLVMEKLDFRTKLGIRDSLYRLAQSANQRNTHASLHTTFENEGKSNDAASIVEGAKRHDPSMETDTNPIDRSMADLLFHRASRRTPQPTHNSFHAPVNFVQEVP